MELCYNNIVAGEVHEKNKRATENCGCSSMVELQPSKLVAWVRFPSPAPDMRL